jgi:hypothetical protein
MSAEAVATATARCFSLMAATSLSDGPGSDGRFIFRFAVTAATDSAVRGRTLPSARFDAVTLCRLSSWMGGAVGLLARETSSLPWSRWTSVDAALA